MMPYCENSSELSSTIASAGGLVRCSSGEAGGSCRGIAYRMDPARADEVTPNPGDVREVLAQAFYPSDSRATEPTDVYAPFDREITQATGWSQPGAPFTAKIGKASVIVLCPGMGELPITERLKRT